MQVKENINTLLYLCITSSLFVAVLKLKVTHTGTLNPFAHVHDLADRISLSISWTFYSGINVLCDGKNENVDVVLK